MLLFHQPGRADGRCRYGRPADRDRDHFYDRIEVIVDAELGILLRREETFEGQRLTLTELATVMPSPPEAVDPARFAPPPGSHISQGLGESLRQTFGGPGWQTAGGGKGRSVRGGHGELGRDPAADDAPTTCGRSRLSWSITSR